MRRESNVEIRELEAKLRQAYVNRALAVQVRQKELSDQREKEEQEVEHQRQEVLRLQALEADRLEEQKSKVESLKLQKALDAQLEDRKKSEEANFRYYILRKIGCLKICALILILKNLNLDRQFLVEKKLIDEIISRVKEEEKQRLVVAMKKKQVEADTIREFVETQKLWAEQENRRNDEENRQIIHFIEKKDRWRAEQEAIAKDRR